MDALAPHVRARITGGVYLAYFVLAILGAVVAPGMSGLGGATADASATANDIVAHDTAGRVGWALTLLSTAFYVALVALFYRLLRPVSGTIALLAAFFGLTECAVTAFGSLFQLAPLFILKGGSYLSVFDAKQLQALSLLFLNLGVGIGYIALVLAGFFQLGLGYLIYRSTFLPRFIGVLIAVAGAGWLLFLAPPLANRLLTVLEVVGFAAELLFMLWLLIRGVNDQRWNEMAAKVSPIPAA